MTKSICVFCGARMGNNSDFGQAALDLGYVIAKNEWRLVYGAGDVGLMGAVAEGTQVSGAATFGVIPEHLMLREVGKRDLDKIVITDDMHSRKKLMFTNSDAVVLLPGGVGSMEEFFEVLTWRQLGLHEKPIYLLDIDGYWAPLSTLMTHIVAEGFAGQSLVDFIQSIETVALLETHLKAYLNV